MAVTLEKIHQAADAIAGRVVKTPCTKSKTLSKITGADVRLKFENQQFTASAKQESLPCRPATMLNPLPTTLNSWVFSPPW
jgi:hypothetical protein